MARQSNSGMLIGAAVLLGGLHFLSTRKAAAATGAGAAAPSSGGAIVVPGSAATTASALGATNAIWGNLTQTTGPYSGFVNFPTGSQAAAGLLPWATDNQGNYYTQWAGHIYLVPIGFSDVNGNYTATTQIS